MLALVLQLGAVVAPLVVAALFALVESALVFAGLLNALELEIHLSASSVGEQALSSNRQALLVEGV